MKIAFGYVSQGKEERDQVTVGYKHGSAYAAHIDTPGNDQEKNASILEITTEVFEEKNGDLLDIAEYLHQRVLEYKKRIKDHTLFLKTVVVQEKDQHFHIVRAGGEHPLMRKPGSRDFEELPLKGMALGFPINVVRDKLEKVIIPSTHEILLYSDSLKYLQNKSGKELSKEGLLGLCKNSLPHAKVLYDVEKGVKNLTSKDNESGLMIYIRGQ